ncbi:hypothetical protein BC937DRAFT_92756, partial [Endogone sp. FLAS-F59071]
MPMNELLLLDETTAPYQTIILNEQYDIVILSDTVIPSDKPASATAILQVARGHYGTILTFDTVYLNHEEEVRQSRGVIVLRLDFEYESHEDKVEWLWQFLKFARSDINAIMMSPGTAWTARRLGDNSWKLEPYEFDIDEVALSRITDFLTWSDEEWLPQWTSNGLVGKRFYYFSSGSNLKWLPSEDDPDTYFPNSIKIHVVDSVLETLDEEKYLTLTFDENTIGVDDSTDEKLKHEILLRDPIVRSFIEKHEVDQNRFSAILAWSPLRYVVYCEIGGCTQAYITEIEMNTRWKISDVLEIYLSNAWFFSDTDAVTCIRDWDEDKFNKEYKREFKAIKPSDAVNAALFIFYTANEDAVAKASDTHTKPDPVTEPKSTTLPIADNKSFAITTFEKLRMGYAFTNRGEPVHKEVFKINQQSPPVFDAFDKQSEDYTILQSEWTKGFMDNHMDVHSANSYLHLFPVDSSHDNIDRSLKEDAQIPVNYRYFIRDIVKATISFKKENLIVTPDFKKAVEEVFYKPDKLTELRNVFDEYGYFWPASIHIGGKVVWSTEYSESANAFGRDFSRVDESIQKKVALFDSQLADANKNIEPATNPQPLHPTEELEQVLIKQKIYGGEENSGSYTIWRNSVNTDSTTWNIVSRKDVIPIWRLLDDNLQNKVDQLIAELSNELLVPFNGVHQLQNRRTMNFLSWKNVYYNQTKQDEAGKIIATEDSNDIKWRIVRVEEDENNNYLQYGDSVYIQPSTTNTECLHLSMDLRSPVTNVEGQLSLRKITSSASIGENEQWIVEHDKDEYQNTGDRSPFVKKLDVFRLSSSVRKDTKKLYLASDNQTMEMVEVRQKHEGDWGRLHKVESIGLAHKLREVLVLNGDIAENFDEQAGWKVVSEVRTDMVRILLDENVLDLAETLQSIPGIDVDNVKRVGIQGRPDSITFQTAEEYQRILVTSDTGFLFSNQPTTSILILYGRLGSMKFTRLKKELKSK